MRIMFSIAALLWVVLVQVAQAQAPVLLGSSVVEEAAHSVCMPPQEFEKMRQDVQANIRAIERTRPPADKSARRAPVLYDWPLRQASGFNDPSYYSISAYVDHDPAATTFRDYNCGTISYDNHNGTDIQLSPFAWAIMDAMQVEVIAAADGVIVQRVDGQFDRNCACQSMAGNQIALRHSDGSITLYGHMKSGSLTAKTVGQTVAKGEFLGNVGSSGCSSGPHLHFGVYANDTFAQLIDPFSGTCNLLNSTTWWAAQKPYVDPGLLRIMTHNSRPVFAQNCPAGGGAVNAQTTFAAGSTLFLSGSFRQEQINDQTITTIRTPDGSIFAQLTRTTTANVSTASTWTYSLPLPANAPVGTWQYQVTYRGETATKNFSVTAPMPVRLVSFTARAEAETVLLNWQTALEINNDFFSVERSADARNFEAIGRVTGAGTTTERAAYTFTDRNPLPGHGTVGTSYYRLCQTDRDGTLTTSPIVALNRLNDRPSLTILGNPTTDFLRLEVRNPTALPTLQVRICSLSGQILRQYPADGQLFEATVANLTAGIYVVQLWWHGQLLEAQRVLKQ